MDAHGVLVDALCAAHEAWNWNSKQAHSRPLLCFLIEYIEHSAMTPEAKNRINEDAAALMHVSSFFLVVSLSFFKQNVGPCSTTYLWSTRTWDSRSDFHALARG